MPISLMEAQSLPKTLAGKSTIHPSVVMMPSWAGSTKWTRWQTELCARNISSEKALKRGGLSVKIRKLRVSFYLSRSV
jgi:hypothetical protein